MRRVPSGAGHPQANGKMGRLLGEAKARPGAFDGAGGAVAWRDAAKPHRLPGPRAGETPREALEARAPPKDAEAVVDGAAGESHRVHRGRRQPAEVAS